MNVKRKLNDNENKLRIVSQKKALEVPRAAKTQTFPPMNTHFKRIIRTFVLGVYCLTFFLSS